MSLRSNAEVEIAPEVILGPIIYRVEFRGKTRRQLSALIKKIKLNGGVLHVSYSDTATSVCVDFVLDDELIVENIIFAINNTIKSWATYTKTPIANRRVRRGT